MKYDLYELSHSVFIFLQWIIDSTQGLWWKISGYPPELNPETGRSPGYLEVSDVLLKTPDTRVAFSKNMQEFVCKHRRFLPIEYLINPRVSLYTVLGKYVYFAETSCYEELQDLRKFPFTYMAQRVLAEKILKVHQEDLIEFTTNLPKPTCKVIWIFHSTRCGSTALAQAINAIDGWTTLSELTWLTKVLPQDLVGTSYERIKPFYMSDHFSRLAKACIVSQLMHYSETDKVCWKMDFINTPSILPLISKEFPEHKVIAMTRRGDQTANSLCKAYNSGFIAKLPSIMLNLLGTRLLQTNGGRDIVSFITHTMLTPEAKQACFSGNMTPYAYVYFLWASFIAFKIDICQSLPNLKVLAIDHGFFMDDLTAGLIEVFDHAGIDKKHLQTALDSYRLDSQENSDHLSRDSLNRRKTPQPNGREIEKCNEISKAFGLPPHGETITKELFGFDHWRYLMK